MKLTLIVLGVVVILLVIAYAYYGGFYSVNVKQESCGGETLVYEDVVGSYKQTAEVSDRVYKELLHEGVKTTKGFGIFHDNPKVVEESKLRSEVGCILDDSIAVASLSPKFKVKVYPHKEYVTTEFPYKGMASVIIGLFKVYPILNSYMLDQGYEGGSVMEVYDVPNKKIYYRQEFTVK